MLPQRLFPRLGRPGFSEANWIYSLDATANDPSFVDGSLWGMLSATTVPANTYGSQAAELWQQNIVGSDTVYVVVIDTGIDISHPDLSANIWRNPFDPVDGVDNDGNGYVDDVNGWDFYNNDNTVADDNNHGTHVAGTIGAVGGNGLGVAGMNWRVRLIGAKFLGAGGSGSSAAAISALQYITDLKVRHGLNIVVTNNSWGGGGYSQALHAAVIRAAKAGILFAAAAGNGNSQGVGQNNDVTPFYPAS